jgi:hypothetical protein
MARKPKQPAAQTPEAEAPETPQKLTVEGLDSAQLVELLNEAIGASESHWNGKKYKLTQNTKDNEKLYLGENVSDRDDGSDEYLSLDNRIFSSIRTVVPFATSRITQPEVHPSSNEEAAKKFAEDFEKAIYQKAKTEKVKAKVKFAIEDAIVRRRGYLKPRYDATTGNFCSIEYIPAESVIVDHKAKPYEEPKHVRFLLDKTVGDLITMFPAMEDRIKILCNINGEPSLTQLATEIELKEDWKFVTLHGEVDLVVCWHYKNEPLGVIKDPNWRYDDNNFLPHHMMPLIPFNVLSDGRGWIDRTSFVEQSKYLQLDVDRASSQISKNAGLGSVGMPIVDAEALGEEQSQYLDYEEGVVISLNVPEGKTIQQVFDKWQASSLSPDVYKNKMDNIVAIQNTFGASNVNQGQQSENNTLGQDVLLRDQSQGRQQEIVDAIDNAMERLYMFIAQFMLVYGNEQELFKIVGENAEFDYVIMHTDSLDTNAEISVSNGSSMPIDTSQLRATADKAASQQMIDPLTYWEIMDQPNAQKYAKRLADFTSDPASFLKDVTEEVFDRDAYVDIETIKRGEQPNYRDHLNISYFEYLNKVLQSGELDNPTMDPATKQLITDFVAIQLQRAQQMLGLAETQLPTTQDVTDYNAQVDQQNQAAAAAPPPAGGQPAATPPTAQPVTQ